MLLSIAGVLILLQSISGRSEPEYCKDFYNSVCFDKKTPPKTFKEARKLNDEQIKKIIKQKQMNLGLEFDNSCTQVRRGASMFVSTIKNALKMDKTRKAPGSSRSTLETETTITYRFETERSALTHCVLYIEVKGPNFILDYGFVKKKVGKMVEYSKTAPDISESFLIENDFLRLREMDAFDKTRLFYHNCKAKTEKSSLERLEEVTAVVKDIIGTTDPFESRETHKDSIKKHFRFCRESNEMTRYQKFESTSTDFSEGDSQICTEFTKVFAELHLKSAKSLFTVITIDAVKKKVDSNEKIVGITQPGFIGTYDKKIRKDNCKAKKSDIEVKGVRFESKEDLNNLQIFRSLSRLMHKEKGEKTDSELKEMVKIEKALFMHSIDPAMIEEEKYFAKSVTKMSIETLKGQLPNIVDWDLYFKQILGVKFDDSLDDFRVVIFCKSYLLALEKIMESTHRDVLMDYIEMASFFSMVEKYPNLLPSNYRHKLRLKGILDCEKFTQIAFSHAVGKLFSEEINLLKKKEVVESLIGELKGSLEEIVRDSHWMPERAKEMLQDKVSDIKVTIGIPYEDWENENVNSYYELVNVTDDILGTVISINGHNYREEMKALYDKNRRAGPDSKILTSDPNAAYDLQENVIEISAGILSDYFIREGMSNLDLYAVVGFMIAHEISHSLGFEGIVLNKDGVIAGKRFTGELVKKMNSKAKHLRGATEKICREGKVTVDFKTIKEEMAADLIGFKVAWRAYEERMGDKIGRQTERRFFKTAAGIFCDSKLKKRSSKKLLKKEHAPPACRVNVISHTERFNRAFICEQRNRPEIRFW